ncbi:HD-like signal output (HDOD) domain, no enzymatic activity [Pseudidiomarina planktonica]|uniref:HD-like signal output (HDOD) domain, no enzymatic activity n=1 Tax=Pseudidiomarina planktonica TaxID=1323738 RepID=A0A1Y6F828_9GAMM|nr:HDOD domain-containing protein [Pseudidiomarina planktonica]RUO64919.1 HDOD domain-containing protein [Pseudidiomarina planktonica]SMQ69741.1 HD-like signal output (HDOD) domain, no enzymatic activity [Pseudidiomarina planktonica]
MAIVITKAEKQLLQSVSIPPRPETLLKISAEAKKDEPDVSVVAEAIAADMGISAAVLQVVNSAAFRRVREIESIQQAVMTLGFRRVFPIVRAVALKSALSNHALLENFWDYNERVAAASVLVAERLGKNPLRDHVYMLGLFQGAGIPVMLAAFDDYDTIFERSQDESWDQLLKEERERYQTTHTTVGALLAQQWRLPKLLVEVIYYLHEEEGIFESDDLDALGLDLLGVVKIGRYIADQQERQEAGRQEWLSVQDAVLNHFQLDDYQLEEMLSEINEELNEH